MEPDAPIGRLRQVNAAVRAVLITCLLAIASAACSSAGSVGSGVGSGGNSGGNSGGGSVGSGGGSVGSSGDSGVGGGPVVPTPGGSGPAGRLPPGQGLPTIVVPKPGRLDVHPVGAIKIEVIATKPTVVVQLSWWSGVAPCSVLDSVGVTRTGQDIRLTIREGADQLGVACIEIAMLKATLVDLGQLGPGTYTVSAGGEAPPVRVVVG